MGAFDDKCNLSQTLDKKNRSKTLEKLSKMKKNFQLELGNYYSESEE